MPAAAASCSRRGERGRPPPAAGRGRRPATQRGKAWARVTCAPAARPRTTGTGRRRFSGSGAAPAARPPGGAAARCPSPAGPPRSARARSSPFGSPTRTASATFGRARGRRAGRGGPPAASSRALRLGRRGRTASLHAVASHGPASCRDPPPRGAGSPSAAVAEVVGGSQEPPGAAPPGSPPPLPLQVCRRPVTGPKAPAVPHRSPARLQRRPWAAHMGLASALAIPAWLPAVPLPRPRQSRR